jgi:hypothetical protein
MSALSVVSSGARGIVAVVELQQLEVDAAGGVRLVEMGRVEPAAGGEGQADLAGGACQRHRLPEDHGARGRGGRRSTRGLRLADPARAEATAQQHRGPHLAQPKSA